MSRTCARVREKPVALAVLAASLVSLVVRLPFLAWPLTVDEAGYAYGARWWFNGLTLYSHDLWFDRPQGIFVVYEVGLAALGDSVEAIRFSGALWAAATAAVVVVLAGGIFDRRVGVTAGLLCAVAGAAPAIEGFTANAEVFMVAATTGSALAAWNRRWLVAGLLAGVAILLKPSGAAAVALAIFWLVHERESRRAYLLFLAAVATPLLASVIHGVATVGLEDYWFAVVWFRFTAGGQNPALASLLVGWFETSLVWVVLGALAYPGRETLSSNVRGRAFIGGWLVASVLGMAMGGNWFQHYFQQLVPPVAVLAAVGVTAIATRPSVVRRWPLVVGASVTVVFAALVLPMAVVGPTSGAARVFTGDDYQGSDEAGAYVRSITGPDDRVYVAMSHVSVLYGTGRRSTLPYLYIQQLTNISGVLDEVAADLEGAVPAVVVVYRPQLESWDSAIVEDPLERRYRLDRAFGEFEVWRRQGADPFAADR